MKTEQSLKITLRFALMATFLFAWSGSAEEVGVRISNYGHGRITFEQHTNAAYYRVDWAPQLEDEWSGSWARFQCILPEGTNGLVEIAVPQFYRVTAILKGYPGRPAQIDPLAYVDHDELVLIPRGSNITHHVYPTQMLYTNVPLNTIIDYDLWIGKYEATYDLYNAVRSSTTTASYVMNSGARGTDRNRRGFDASHLNQPVTEVNWYDALKFCNKLSELTGLSPVYRHANDVFRSGEPPFDEIAVAALSDGFRLPTEAEWEYCARGGLNGPQRMFPWGDTIDSTYAIYYYTVDAETQAVGSYPKGIAGGQGSAWDLLDIRLYDMGGNVYEWVWDRSGDPAVYTYNLKCSGAAYTSSSNLRCISRQFSNPSTVIYGSGFRVCRSSK
jgi:formylglycine-generating enzyme required for sulfatase activity